MNADGFNQRQAAIANLGAIHEELSKHAAGIATALKMLLLPKTDRCSERLTEAQEFTQLAMKDIKFVLDELPPTRLR
jgi:GTPase involved in cell partitioning and DNA repair